MSHKIAAPPISPFYDRVVYADADSTSQVEDGTVANPYKTLQAALDARPAPADADAANTPWYIRASGVFDENLVWPTEGVVRVIGQGTCDVGTAGGPARTISWVSTGTFVGVQNVLGLENVTLYGAITASEGAPAPTNSTLDIKDCTFSGAVDVSLVDNSAVLVDRCSFAGGLNCALSALTMVDSSTTGSNITCDSLVEMRRTQVDGGLLIAGTGTDESIIERCSVAANVTLRSARDLRHTTITGNLLVTGSATVTRMSYCTFGGNVAIPEVEFMDHCTFGGTLSVSGGATDPVMNHCNFLGLVNITGGPVLDRATGCVFAANIVVDAAPTRGFFGCQIVGNFSGPAGSYKVDGATRGLSSPAFSGGATLDSVGVANLVDLDDTPAGYGSAGQVLTSNGSDAATWEDPASGGDGSDWVNQPGVITDFSDDTPYYDLGTGVDSDGEATAVGVGTIGGGAALRYTTDGTATLVGRFLCDIPGGDCVVAARIRTAVHGVGVSATTTMFAAALVSFFLGTDRVVDEHRSVGFYRRNQDHDSGGIGYVQGRRDLALTASVSSNNSGITGPRLGSTIDVVFQLSGTTLTAYVSDPGGGGTSFISWSLSLAQAAAPKQLVTMASGGPTAAHTVTVDVLAVAPPGVFTSYPLFDLD